MYSELWLVKFRLVDISGVSGERATDIFWSLIPEDAHFLVSIYKSGMKVIYNQRI